jgi:hypothetical protein
MNPLAEQDKSTQQKLIKIWRFATHCPFISSIAFQLTV